MTLAELGFDTTLTFDCFQMSGCSDTFNIVKVIFWRKSLASRGTTGFSLTKTGDDESLDVLKDSWRGFGHHSEVELATPEGTTCWCQGLDRVSRV